METKKIFCYNCHKAQGIAYKFPHQKMNPNTGKIETMWGWKLEGWKSIDRDLWLCPTCEKTRRCKKCLRMLSNTNKCNCGKIHGAYYKKHPDYCKECWDEIKKII